MVGDQTDAEVVGEVEEFQAVVAVGAADGAAEPDVEVPFGQIGDGGYRGCEGARAVDLVVGQVRAAVQADLDGGHFGRGEGAQFPGGGGEPVCDRGDLFVAQHAGVTQDVDEVGVFGGLPTEDRQGRPAHAPPDVERRADLRPGHRRRPVRPAVRVTGRVPHPAGLGDVQVDVVEPAVGGSLDRLWMAVAVRRRLPTEAVPVPAYRRGWERSASTERSRSWAQAFHRQ